MKDPRNLTPAEFELVEILWEAGRPLTVSQVLSAILPIRNLAYTTVMTVLDKLTKRKTLGRIKKGRAYLYHPRVERRAVMAHLFLKFTRDYCGGDPRRLSEWVPPNGVEESSAAPQRTRQRGNTPHRPVTLPSPAREEEEELDVELL